MRPTGKLHLGHLVGALNNWARLQNEYHCFYMIADWHALMSEYENPKGMREDSVEMVRDFVAAGLDPDKCVIFVQSQVPEHLELYTIFSDLTPLAWVERCPTYKEQLREIKGRELTTYGFLGYPVLQAADIAVYKANAVPVGVDQIPHLELTREIVRRFNTLYKKEIFPEPEAVLTQVPKVPGLDGRKMSKSYGNGIYLADSKEEVVKKVKAMVTDPARKVRSDKGHPEVCPVFFYHKLFNKDQAETVACECREAARGCVDCKMEMAAKLNEFLGPIRERRESWMKKKTEIRQILDRGAKRAREVASQTLKETLQAMGLVS